MNTSSRRVGELKLMSLHLLERVCEPVNRVFMKRLDSYKATNTLIKNVGFPYCTVDYLTSYVYKDNFVDVYKCKQSCMLIYAEGSKILGVKVKDPEYPYRKYLDNTLKGYSVLETSGGVIYKLAI